MNNRVLDFYTNPDFEQPIVRARSGKVVNELLAVPNDGIYLGDTIPDALKPVLADNITRLYDSVKPRKVIIDGNEYTFEIGCINGIGDEAELRVATYQSSLTGNYGNGFEVASMAAENPKITYVYVASLGMGLSSSITSQERKYLRKHGRLIDEENGIIKPLPVVRALGKAIYDMDLDITRLGSDSAGALMAMAYGAVYGDGAIKSAHQNVRTGITDKNIFALAKGMLHDDPKLSKVHAQISPDALRMNDEKIDLVKASISKDYIDKDYDSKKSPAMLWAYLRGLGKGPNRGNPLINDNIAFARANPDAHILFTVGDQDPLARSNDLDNRIRQVVRFISLHSEGTVSAVIIEGGNHGTQTHYPQFLRTLAKTALK